MPKRSLKPSSSNRESSNIDQSSHNTRSTDQRTARQNTRNEFNPRRIVYTRSAKTAAKNKIERCLNPRVRRRKRRDTTMSEGSCDSIDDITENASKRSRSGSISSEEATVAQRSRLESTVEEDDTLAQRAREYVEDNVDEELDDQIATEIRSIDEIERYARVPERISEFLPARIPVRASHFHLNPSMYTSYQRLLSEIPLRSLHFYSHQQSTAVPQRLVVLMNMLENASSVEASPILSEINEFILLNNDDNLQNLPKRAFVTLMCNFIPPNQTPEHVEINEANAILACKALCYMCEAVPMCAVAIARAVNKLLGCLDNFTVVDVAEQSLKVLEYLVRHNQARPILINEGVFLCLDLFDFLSYPSLLSVLLIVEKCVRVVRPSLNEYRYIEPFIEFTRKGLNLQDSKLSGLVCSALNVLASNFRVNRDCVKQLTNNALFVDALKEAFDPKCNTIPAENRYLLLCTISSLCFGCSSFTAEILSIPNLSSIILELFQDAAKLPSDHNTCKSKYADNLYDILSIIDVVFSQSSRKLHTFLQFNHDERGNVFDTVAPKTVWQWKDDAFGWQSYSVSHCWIIEIAFINNYDEISPITINDRYYTINFKRMLQINEDTGSARNIQRLPSRSYRCVKDAKSTATMEELVRTLFLPIYKLSQNAVNYSYLLHQRCWTLLTQMMMYTILMSSSKEFKDSFYKILVDVDLMNCIYSLLNSNRPILIICGLISTYCVLSSSILPRFDHLQEDIIYYGLYASLENLHDYSPDILCQMRTYISEQLIEISGFQQSFNRDRVDTNRIRRRPVNDADNLGQLDESIIIEPPTTVHQPTQSMTQDEHLDSPTRSDASRRQQDLLFVEYYEWIRYRSLHLNAQLSPFYECDVVMIEYERLGDCLRTDDRCDPALMQSLKGIHPKTTVYQLVESSLLESMFIYFNIANNNTVLMSRIRHLTKLLSLEGTSKSQSITLKCFTEKLISCINFSERFYPHDSIRSSSQGDNISHTSTAVIFNEIRGSADIIWCRRRIGPIIYAVNVKISEVIQSLWYYHTFGWTGKQLIYSEDDKCCINPFLKIDVMYRDQILDPESTLADCLSSIRADSRLEEPRTLKFSYRITSIQTLDMSPETWLLQTLYTTSHNYVHVDKHSKFPLLLMRFLSLLYRHYSIIDPCTDINIPSDTFIVEKLSSIVIEALQDPVRLFTDSSFPKWMYFLVYECFTLLPFETRQTAFYAFHLPRPLLFARYAEQGILTFAHGTEQFGRLHRKKAIVRRQDILKSAEDLFIRLQMYHTLDVSFEDEVGYGNGPTNEFFALVSKECQQLDIWAKPSEQSNLLGLIPFPIMTRISREKNTKLKSKFRFIGKLVAKSILDFKLLDLPLSVVVYKWLLSEENSLGLHDMKYVDTDLYRQLLRLNKKMISIKSQKRSDARKKMHKELSEELQECYLNFTLPGYPQIELVKHGKSKDVDISNLAEYIELVVRWRLISGIRKQMEAMRDAFYAVIPLSAIKCFHADELHFLVCGNQDEQWTADSLHQHCKFVLGYDSNSDQIKWLFKIISSYNQLERRQFLQFVSGTPCLPFGGLKALCPSLTIAKTVNSCEGADLILPSVMTCKNYIKLPEYSSFEILEQRFQIAIQEGRDSFMLS